jgi:hypothetical protein
MLRLLNFSFNGDIHFVLLQTSKSAIGFTHIHLHSLFVPNIALFPTYLSFFTADRLSCFENLAIAPITSGLRQFKLERHW